MKHANIRWIVGTAWVLGGATLIGFGQLADALGHTGERLYRPAGDKAFLLGLVLLLVGGLMSLPAALTNDRKHPVPTPTSSAEDLHS